MIFQVTSYKLTDAHLTLLSKQLKAEEIHRLGIGGLGLPESYVDEKVSKHVFSPEAINSIILHKWWGDFKGDDTEAYNTLCTALNRSKLKGMKRKLDIFSKKEAKSESQADNYVHVSALNMSKDDHDDNYVYVSPPTGMIDSSEKMY